MKSNFRRNVYQELLCLMLVALMFVLTACSGEKKEPETESEMETQIMTETETEAETEYVEIIPEKNILDHAQPIPADTGTLELSSKRFERSNLILQLPEGVSAQEEEADELYGYVKVTDDAGEWQLLFQPFVDGTNLINDVGQNWEETRYLNEESEEEKERVSKKKDWSVDIAGSVAGFQARCWANNTEGKPYEGRITDVPAVDIILDYGDLYVGRYYGLYIRLTFQNPKEDDNIYEILNRRAVRSIINNISVIEAKDFTEATGNGVSISFPAKWSVLAENNSINGRTRGDRYESFNSMINPTIITPKELTENESNRIGEVDEVTYGEISYFYALCDSGTEENHRYYLSLHTSFDETGGLVYQIYVYVNGASKEEMLAYMDDEIFTEIMNSIIFEPDKYTNSGRIQTEDFFVQEGELVSYTGTEEHLVIPSELKGSEIKSIGMSAFYENTTLKSVEIPDSVTYIGAHAFQGCTNLEHVRLPDGLTRLEEETFAECALLTDVILPEGVSEVGRRAFFKAGNGSFQAKGGAIYGEECFELSGFDSIQLAEGSDISAKDIFRESAIKDIVLPSDLAAIGEGAFSHCFNLVELVLPNSVTTLGEGCFSSMSELKKLTLSENLTELPYRMTDVSMEIVLLSIPPSVKKICQDAVYADYVFLHNADVVLEDGALNINELYMENVYTPEEVPENLENQYIYKQVLIPMDGTEEMSAALDDYYDSIGMNRISWFGISEEFSDTDVEDYVAEGKYLTAYLGSKKEVLIPPYAGEGGAIVWLKSDVFAGNTTIERISLGCLNSIDSRAFDGCANLKEMWIGVCNLTFFDDDDSDGGVLSDAFAGTPEGMTVYLPESLGIDQLDFFKEKMIAKGMPESTQFETYRVEDGKAVITSAEDETEDMSEIEAGAVSE